MSRPTVHTLEFTEADLKGGADYGSFKAGNYVGILESVEDVKADTGNVGWKWKFSVEGLIFDTVTWLKGGGVWKLNEIINSLGGSLEAGVGVRIDPMLYLGSRAGVTIGKDPKSKYPDRLTILRTFPLADEEDPGGIQEL